MKEIETAEYWEFPDTEYWPNMESPTLESEPIPELTKRNFLFLIDRYNNLAEAVKELQELVE